MHSLAESPSRPTLILLPPLPCGAEYYAAQIAALSDLVDPKVMVLEELSLAASAAMVLAAAPSRFLLAGTAYGGCLAIEIAVTAPERIAGLWLMNCNPGAHPDPVAARQIGTRARGGAFDAILHEWSELIVAEEAVLARERFLAMARAGGPARFARQHDAAADRFDHWDDLRRITAPTLLLWGADDRFVPVAVGKRIAEAMPHARFAALPGCRHFPTLEQPEAAMAIARDWLLRTLASSDR
jgi:pimeloyl-ACP methyl ester carboxylesterase